MSFRYQPDHFAPDPWPVQGPTELDDDDYAQALRTVPTPRVADIIAQLDSLSGQNVIVWMLFLGQTFGSDAQRPRDEVLQGYYIRSVVRNRANLREAFRILLPWTSRSDPVRASNQLLLSTFMSKLGPEEQREKVVGWGFASQ